MHKIEKTNASGVYKKYLKYKSKYLHLKNIQRETSIQMSSSDKQPVYDIHLSEPWYTLIKEGKKIAEGRPNKGLFAKLQIGDTIKFFNINKFAKTREGKRREFLVKVTDKKTYKTFREMLETEGLDNVLPDPKVKTVEDGVNVYRQWYNEEIESQFGVVAIHIQTI